MTQIETTVYRDAYELKADGHATGSVEVCAAISVLMQAAALWVWRHGGRDDQVLEDGHACVVIPRSIPGSKAVYDLINSALETIAEDDENFCNFWPNLGHESEFRLLQ